MVISGSFHDTFRDAKLPNSKIFTEANGFIHVWLSCLDVGGENVRVTSIEDSHGGAAEELTASGAKLNAEIYQ